MNAIARQNPAWIDDTKTQFPALFKDIHPCNFGCGEGWKTIINDLCTQIKALGLPNLRVVQIKEKFGGLRFYVDGADNAVYDLIAEAEKKASQTCELCGAPGKEREGGWYATMCAPCRDRIAERKAL